MEDDCQSQQQQQQGEGEEGGGDFSFPLIVGNSPCSIESPPWHYSPSTPTRLEGGREKDTGSRVKEEEAQKMDMLIKIGSREEKMDMLWEDFNEELWGNSTTSEKRHSKSGCVKVTALSKKSNKGGGALSSPAKSPGALAFVKALRKKLFLFRGVVAPGPIKTRRLLSQR